MLDARTFSRQWHPFRAAATNWLPCVIAPPAAPGALARHSVSPSGHADCRECCAAWRSPRARLILVSMGAAEDRQLSSGCRLPSPLVPTAGAARPRPSHQPRITRQRVTTQAAPPGTLTASVNHRLRGVIPVRPHTYEITFSGQAGRTLRAQFDDCKVTTGPDTTILRAELPDQAALSGLVQRIVGLGLVVIDVHLVTPGSGP